MIRPSRWSLRQRLLAAVLVLAAAGLLVAGLLTTAALRSYLLGDVDRRLMEVSGPLAQPGEGPADPPWLGPGGFPGPAAFYTQVTQNGLTRVATAPLDAGDPPDLPLLTVEEVDRIAGEPFTVGSGGSAWRVVAWPLPDGSGSVMIAASLASVAATVTRLVWLEAAIGLLVLGALAAAGGLLVDRGLRPLAAVADTASSIAAGNLQQRAPVLDPGTEVGALAASFNTMLDRLQASFEAQAASQAAARASEERMRQFVADASHELRTPLTTVRGFAELQRMGALATPQQVAEAMGRIEAESERMGALVGDLLLLARLDAERAPVNERVDVGEVAREALSTAWAAWPEQACTLDAAPGAEVLGDPERLRQVVLNLLSNASRYNPAGLPIEVRVATDPGEVVVSVRDHGPGVPTDQRDRIFERFVRADEARARQDGGTGLGLSIVSTIVADLGGAARAQDAPGGGALFEVRLPAAQPR